MAETVPDKCPTCPTCGSELKNTGKTWRISHPGTGAPVFCDSFEECMDKWFEGFNTPFEILNGQVESSERARARVKAHFGRKAR